MILFFTYSFILLGLGLFEARRKFTPDAFFVNNRSSGAWGVGFSVLASCVGGSATIGMAGLAFEVGTPAFWWLGSGASGLVILTVFLARTIRQSGAYTLPQMVVTTLGKPARSLVSVIILAAWLAILAAQFTAMGKITAALTGFVPQTALFAGAALIVAYSLLGGQAAVIRSDILQYAVVMFGLVLTLAFLLDINGESLRHVPLEAINPQFPLSRLQYFLVILGGSYVVCPMLFGRFLSARDTRSAVRGGAGAIIGLVLTATVIVLLGLLCRGVIVQGTPADDVLTTALISHLPKSVGIILLLALFSAVISSADSCLVTAVTVCCNDLLGNTSLRMCRSVTVLFGAGALYVAGFGKGILGLLLMANDIYVCGVVAPVFMGMMFERYGKPPLHSARSVINSRWAIVAVSTGGLLGLTASLAEMPAISYMGIICSIACCTLGRFTGARSMPDYPK